MVGYGTWNNLALGRGWLPVDQPGEGYKPLPLYTQKKHSGEDNERKIPKTGGCSEYVFLPKVTYDSYKGAILGTMVLDIC